MSYFLAVDSHGNSFGTWKIDAEGACLLFGQTGPQQTLPVTITPSDGETPYDAASRTAQDLNGRGITLVETILAPGEYYPRIARPSNFRPGSAFGAKDYLISPSGADDRLVKEMSIASGQLSALNDQLNSICQTIHPENTNLDSYGHTIRNLLILACTEVEAQWAAVLQANGATPINRSFTTHDYVKLSDAMKLVDYAVSLPYYPWLPPIKPFDGWGSAHPPTQTLPWYNAYNKVKHDRENNFTQAKLKFAFDAVAACAVMLCAQYGDEVLLQPFFAIYELPSWPAEEWYIRPFDGTSVGGWTEKAYAF
jgi:hypothetical protein